MSPKSDSLSFVNYITFQLNYLTSRYANQLLIGNELLNNRLTPVKVIKVSKLSMKGNKCNSHLQPMTHKILQCNDKLLNGLGFSLSCVDNHLESF